MYGYIYLTTNLINGKKYIGQHQATEFDKNYSGSGKLIKQAFKKYGRSNFKTELIESCNNQDELNKREKYWIGYYKADESNDFYNISNGGASGFGGLVGDKNPAKRLDVREKMSKNHHNVKKENNPNYGKQMTDEQKQKISQARILNGSAKGSKNPMYGRRKENNPSYKKIHINKDGKDIMINKSDFAEYEKDGWKLGRGYIVITNGKENKYINPKSVDKYDGWWIGKTEK